MTASAVTVRHAEHISVLTLNRPDNRNSMTKELLESFNAAIDVVIAQKPRCVIVTGSGRCFSAGADFRAQIQSGEGSLPHQRSFAMYKPFLRVRELSCPVIAAINGHCVGGGFGLALCCDIRIGVPQAKYGANFVRLGLHPGLAISYLLPRIVGLASALDLLLVGELIDGKRALALGLLSECVAPDALEETVQKRAQVIAANAPLAVALTKRSIYEFLECNVHDAAYRESFRQAETIATDDCNEGIQALLEKRPPDFRGK